MNKKLPSSQLVSLGSNSQLPDLGVCSSDHSTTGSPDTSACSPAHRITGSPDPAPCSPDHRITGSPDRLLVIGCGGPFAADDNAGLDVVRRLQGRGDCDCEFLELTGGALDLVYSFEKADIILFVDAVQSGAPAGTVHLLPLPSQEVVPRALGRLSSHGWGLDETLRLARSLGKRLPRLMLLGVELGSVAPGTPRTPAVEAAVDMITERFPELQTALRDSGSPLWSRHVTYVPLEQGWTWSQTDKQSENSS